MAHIFVENFVNFETGGKNMYRNYRVVQGDRGKEGRVILREGVLYNYKYCLKFKIKCYVNFD